MATRSRRRSSRRSRSAVALRWVGALVVVAILFAYVQPFRSYRAARVDVKERRAEVSRLERETARLEDRLAWTETDDFVVREARRLQLVRPGERLFIVTGVNEWREKQRADKARIP